MITPVLPLGGSGDAHTEAPLPGVVSRTGPDPHDVHRPTGPDVVLLESSPTFHKPARLDDLDVDVEDADRVPLAEALRREIPPCPHCFEDWGEPV